MKKLLEAGLDWDWSDDDGCARCFMRWASAVAVAVAAAAWMVVTCIVFADIQHFWLRAKVEAKRSRSLLLQQHGCALTLF